MSIKKKVNNIISIFIAFLIILCILILFKSIQNNNLYIGLQIIFLLVYSSILIKQISRNSYNQLIDIRLYVIFTYIIYNLYIPIIFIFLGTNYIEYYGIIYNAMDLANSLKVSIVYFVAFSIPLILCSNIRKTISNKEIEKYREFSNLSDLRYKKVNFYIWLILFSIAFLWYVYPYIRIGFGEALSYGRWVRYEQFSAIKNNMGIIGKVFNTFFSSFLIIISTFMLFKNIAFEKRLKKEKRLFILLIVFEFIFYLFIDQRRREFMYIIIMIFSYKLFYSYYEINLKKIRKYVVVIIVLAAVFISYQSYRNYFDLAYKNGIDYALQVKSKDDEKNKLEKLYYSEFGCVYINNLCTVKYTPDLFYGKTYLEALLTPVPIISKILPEWLDYDEYKTSLITKWQSDIYASIFENGGGLGFSPSSEAYLNIGYLGCFLFGIIGGWIFNFIYFKLLKPKHILIYCMILPQGWNFCRITFTGVTTEVFWYILYYVIYTIFIEILTQNKK